MSINSFTSLDRRVFLQGITATSASLLLSTLGGCESLIESIRTRPVRRRLVDGSPEIDAVLASYREAVRQMKLLPMSDPTSWRAQAGIHGTDAGGFNLCQHGSVHFFSWHRAYLFYFERMCQKYSGDDSFGLPYWNWNQNNAIHGAFLVPSSPLFQGRISTSVAGSFAVSDASLDSMMPVGNFFTFSSLVEGSPHAAPHNIVGGVMSGGGSPLDPIFWPHHCMVDYCWAKWNIELENDNPNDPAWTNTSWDHFFDEDGQPVTIDALTTVLMPLLSYRYEESQIGSASLSLSTGSAQRDFEELRRRLEKGAEVVLDIKERYPLTVTTNAQSLRAAPFTSELAPQNVRRLLTSDSASERVLLSIEYAEMPESSDFLVRVFVNAPDADENTPITDPRLAGSFAFFGTKADHPDGHAHGEKTDFLVNASPTLERLSRRGMINERDPITIHLVPVSAKSNTDVTAQILTVDKIEFLISPVTVRSKNAQD